MFLLLPSNYLHAEDMLTWEECVRLAKKNHPERDFRLRSIFHFRFSDNNSYSYDMAGQQLVFDGFKASSEVSNALKTLRAQEYNYNVASSDIRLNLRRAFAGLLKAQELISLTEQIAGRRKQNLELVKLRYEVGREHKGSLLTAEADLAQAEFEVAQAQRSIILAQRGLSKELGLDKMRPWNAKGEFSVEVDYNLKPDLENLVLTTPFLKELIAKKEAARYNLQSAQSDFFPEAYLNASMGKSGSGILPRAESFSAG